MTSNKDDNNFRFADYLGNEIVLTNYYYKHIIERRGSEITKYHKSWEDTLKNPDYTGHSRKHNDCRIFIQKNNKHRNYPAKYFVVVVNGANLITSIRFGNDLNFIENIKEMKK